MSKAQGLRSMATAGLRLRLRAEMVTCDQVSSSNGSVALFSVRLIELQTKLNMQKCVGAYAGNVRVTAVPMQHSMLLTTQQAAIQNLMCGI